MKLARISLLTAATALTACTSPPEGRWQEKQSVAATPPVTQTIREKPFMEDGKERFIYVAPQKAKCVGVGPMECLQFRESEDQPWQLLYGKIEGFDFKPGITYRLRIREFDVPNPPADASAKRWILDMIVEQRAVKP